MSLEIVRGDILDTLLQLDQDPIPNIRFNVSKSLEVLATTFGSTAEGRQLVRQKIAPVLDSQKNDQDADVRFFASKALQKAHSVEVGGKLIFLQDTFCVADGISTLSVPAA